MQLVSVVAQALEVGDALVEARAARSRRGAPTRFGRARGRAAGVASAARDLVERQPDPLRRPDERDAAQDVPREPPVVALGADRS